VLSAAHRWRERVVPPEPEAEANDDVCEHGHPLGEEVAEPFPQRSTHRSGYRPRRELLKRTFNIDLEHCAKCGRRRAS
jgi:hypothetical protein